MKFFLVILISVGCAARTLAQEVQPASEQPDTASSSSALEIEQVQLPEPSQVPPTVACEPGQMEPAELKALLHRIWLAEYRINDLLTEVRPERWKMEDAARSSFTQMLETLRTQLRALDEWRSQFEERADSMYLGFETYVAMGAVLPRLDGVAQSIGRHENPSFGAQFNQSVNRLFDLQQALQPYLSYLLRIQDQLLLAAQSNLAACQNELGYAMRGKTAPATPMKNILPELKGWRVRRAQEAAGKTQPGESRDKASEKNLQ